MSLQRPFIVLLVLLFVTLSSNVNANPSRFLCANSDRLKSESALDSSRQALLEVSHSLKNGGDHTSKMLYKWFGSDSTNTIKQVKQIIDKSLLWSNSVVFYCLYSNDGSLTEIEQTSKGAVVVDYSGKLFAYVDPSNIGEVTLGLAFYSAPKKGFN